VESKVSLDVFWGETIRNTILARPIGSLVYVLTVFKHNLFHQTVVIRMAIRSQSVHKIMQVAYGQY
jgi:hypothetical protein